MEKRLFVFVVDRKGGDGEFVTGIVAHGEPAAREYLPGLYPYLEEWWDVTLVYSLPAPANKPLGVVFSGGHIE